MPEFFKQFPRKLWLDSWAVAQRILLELWRRRRSLIFWAVFPGTILTLNGLILEERLQISRSEAFVNATPATLIGAALFFSCVGGSLATVVTEREQQTLKRLFMAPLSGFAYFLGIFGAHSCIGLGQTLLVLTLTWLLGGQFPGSWALGAIVIFLSVLIYVGVGFILGTQLARRTEDVNALVAAFGIPLLILGGVFLPISLFPESLKRLSQFDPVYHMNEALTAALVAPELPETFQRHLWILVVMGVGVLGGAWLAYGQLLKRERSL